MKNFDPNNRCHELDKILEPLRIFSSKIKHLQLSCKQYNTLLMQLGDELKAKIADTAMDEYYFMQIETTIYYV